MGLEAALRASAEAINELRESLDEQCLSEITVEGTEGGALARFAVRPEEGGETSFTATFIGSSMPAPCVLAVAGGAAARGLARANGRLAGGASLAKAVAGAGRAVGMDLDWAAEAEGDGKSQGWAGRAGALMYSLRHRRRHFLAPRRLLLCVQPFCRRQR